MSLLELGSKPLHHWTEEEKQFVQHALFQVQLEHPRARDLMAAELHSFLEMGAVEAYDDDHHSVLGVDLSSDPVAWEKALREKVQNGGAVGQGSTSIDAKAPPEPAASAAQQRTMPSGLAQQSQNDLPAQQSQNDLPDPFGVGQNRLAAPTQITVPENAAETAPIPGPGDLDGVDMERYRAWQAMHANEEEAAAAEANVVAVSDSGGLYHTCYIVPGTLSRPIAQDFVAQRIKKVPVVTNL